MCESQGENASWFQYQTIALIKVFVLVSPKGE